MKTIRIGTRGSALARWQAEYVAKNLRQLYPTLEIHLQIIKTTGDKILDAPLAKVGGKGLFVKEIEEALLRGEVDVAVHSMKDVPVEMIPGLRLTSTLPREDPRDVLMSQQGFALKDLPSGARVGTSSLRRCCQLLHLRPDLKVTDLRGNVDTRVAKLKAGVYDAILLAAAGLIRLGYQPRISELLPVELFIPAVGQGTLGIETCAADEEIEAIVEGLHHEPTSRCVRAERAFLTRLGGGCQVPIAGHAYLEDTALVLDALVGHPSGKPVYRHRDRGTPTSPEELGVKVAESLLAQGGDRILQEVYSGASLS